MSASLRDCPGIAGRTVIIEAIEPSVDGGRFPVKREVGDTLEVSADCFAEGHERLAVVLKFRCEGEADWREAPMRLEGNDRWHGHFPLERNARYLYTIEAWRDVFESWRETLVKKHAAGEDVASELLEGQRLVDEARQRAVAAGAQADAERMEAALAAAGFPTVGAGRADAARAALLDEGLARVVARHPDRSAATVYQPPLQVVVDRVAARFAAWYEMFHRSQGRDPHRGSTLREAEARLPEIRAMGFDVVYLPPIHPIGRTGRKGANDAPVARPGEPGSPWAVGSEEGGHDAVNPELGTLADFDHFVAACRALGMEVALDFAVQCSPDHPYVRQHPEWFYRRPDGSIRYAENPPKKYQDIFPINFYGGNREGLWQELKRVLLFWAARGVRTFRVDNPHTKPFGFWEWVIREVQRTYPDTIFLSEAFTRPKVMRYLAKCGFTQSYTYFTWRNTKAELIEYLTELTQSPMREYFRGHFFTNTPDILPAILQTGGRPAFKLRLALAATLSSLYGIYNGFELCEGRGSGLPAASTGSIPDPYEAPEVRGSGLPGPETYADSEKYQYKVWDWDRPGNIKGYITTINRIRRDNSALHSTHNLRFCPSDDEHVLAYWKADERTSGRADGGDEGEGGSPSRTPQALPPRPSPPSARPLVIVVNLDPFAAHRSTLTLPLEELGIGEGERFLARELITGEVHTWSGATQVIDLEPEEPAAIFRLERQEPTVER